MPLEPSVVNLSDLNPLWPLGADPASIADDNHRNIKKALLNAFAGYAGSVLVTGTDGGATNAYTLTPTVSLPSYGLKMVAVFAPTVANTGASTLNISSLGTKNLLSVSGVALLPGDLTVGNIYAAFYDGVQFRLTSVTKNYVDQQAFGAVLPAQPGGVVPYPLVSRNGAAAFKGPQTVRVPRTGNTMLVEMDSGQFFDITSSTFTQTFDLPVNLQYGWQVRIRNSGNGNITIPSSDGVVNWIMYPGEDRDFYCDGAALYSAINNAFSMSITSVGANNFVKPPGYSRFAGIAWSGGGGGESGPTTSSLVGGFGGGAFPFEIPSGVLGATTVITIGDGGNPFGGSVGQNGQDTTIGTLIRVLGADNNQVTGGGGRVQNAAISSGSIVGFESSRTQPTIYGGAGSSGGGPGANSIYGGAGGGGRSNTPTSAPGGVSAFGGNGGFGNGTAGAAPGGGGGAGNSGGKGGRGQVDIHGVA